MSVLFGVSLWPDADTHSHPGGGGGGAAGNRAGTGGAGTGMCARQNPGGSFFLSTKYMANDDFLNPLDALIPKIPFSFFAKFLHPGHLWASGPVN